MKVAEVMTTNVITCNENDSISTCAKNMAEMNAGSMPVLDGNGVPVGMITDRDITIRAVANNVNASEARVREYETRNLISAGPEMSVEEASDLMAQNQIRRLPVLEGGNIIGIVALGDLAIATGEQLAGHALHEVSRH